MRTTDKSKSSTSGGSLIVSDRALTSECILWRAVIGTVLDDLTSGKPPLVLEAIDWLNSDDFEEVCDMADVCPHTLKHCAKEIIHEKHHWRRRYMGRVLKSNIVADAPEKERRKSQS